jgi:uncharacterized protein YbjT (DUF2867 family)
MYTRTIAVCGATGQQGGATVQSLLKKKLGGDIIAISRNPNSDKAKALAQQGVKVLKADLLDMESLVAAFRKATMVFGVTQPFSDDYKKSSSSAEVTQGKNIVDACLKVGVEYLVQSTVFNPGTKAFGVPHLDSKTTITTYLKNSGLAYAILKPASFMDNIGTSFFSVKKGKIRGFTDGNAKILYISVKDIGEFASMVFENPALYRKKELDLIADFVSGDELAQILTKIRNGQRFTYSAVPRLAMWIFAREFYQMRKAFEKSGRPPFPPEIEAAIQKCKEMNPRVLTMERYLLMRKFDSITL